MTVEQEEKLLKRFGIFTLILMYPLNQFFNHYIDRDDTELSFVILLMLVILVPALAMIVLSFRKFTRDRKAGKNLKRYKTALFFIGIGLLMSLIFLIYGLSI